MAQFELTEELLLSLGKLPKKSRAQALRIIGKAEFEKCADDPIYWLDAKKHVKTKQWPNGMPYVFTYDPHPLYECKLCEAEVMQNKRGFHLEAHGVKVTSVKQFSEHYKEMSHCRPFTLFEYMVPIIDVWQRTQFLAVEKSRDMMATWMVVTMFTWDALFHNGRQHIFQSEDALKTLELVQRANIIYSNHPKFLRDAIGPVTFGKGGSRSGEFFVLQQKSEILGFPQGPDQIRQFHPSGVFVDEAAFQAEAAAGFAAIKPSIQMGGKYVAISSANRGFFEMVCRDRTDE